MNDIAVVVVLLAPAGATQHPIGLDKQRPRVEPQPNDLFLTQPRLHKLAAHIQDKRVEHLTREHVLHPLSDRCKTDFARRHKARGLTQRQAQCLARLLECPRAQLLERLQPLACYAELIVRTVALELLERAL